MVKVSYGTVQQGNVSYGTVQQGNVAEALRLTEEYLTIGNWIVTV